MLGLIICGFLAHMWGAYAIPVELSIVCRVSSVSTITTRNNYDIKSILGANVHHVPGLCLEVIGGPPTLHCISLKLWLKIHIFMF